MTNIHKPTYPKLVQSFAVQNFNLKVLTAILLGLLTVSLTLVVVLVRRAPTVIALSELGEVAKVETKITDLQIKAAINNYLAVRYNWTDKTITTQLKQAEFFIYPSLISSFQKAMIEVQRFVRDKKVSQRVYPKSVIVNLADKKVVVIADRITEFDTLKAATELRLVLNFTADDRTPLNPWGIFITKETEGASQ